LLSAPCAFLPMHRYASIQLSNLTWSSNMKIGLNAAWPQAHFSLSAGYPKNARSRDLHNGFRRRRSCKVLPASYEEAQMLFIPTIRYCIRISVSLQKKSGNSRISTRSGACFHTHIEDWDSLSGYGPMTSANHHVRTRMRGGVGRDG
jgi:hypothetical protein